MFLFPGVGDYEIIGFVKSTQVENKEDLSLANTLVYIYIYT